ncbi:MAG: hypothetical protein OMM_11829 [Candidatus Magnetoglobus multicellularis str. Araruama]|uniref:ParE-like toxin domain-containing protein n=1 Tax=Candidatus Magnetoglobus multicellularis str. Araruama TaxID=890399 RepID=A0A1V1NXD1_9BACT|nr:MAG: hypothetical protein OMM_11829 [Candidatus Magnetoglobus multicellularis str. Araruama]
MNSHTLPNFWKQYNALPESIQKKADKAYSIWCKDPHSHGLHFKRVSKTRPVYSVRVDDAYRALGLLIENTVTWFWIGDHDEYMKMLKK